MRARCARIRTIFALLLSICFASRMSGQDACSVKEHRRADTLTGEFVLDGITASLTFPKFLNQLDAVAARLEVSRSSESGLVLRFGSESTPLRDGATVEAALRPHERFVFSIHAGDGRQLCSWEPAIVIRKKTYRSVKDPFRLSERFLRITGDPILLPFVHEIGRGATDFRLGGLPAAVLAENRREVVLRDPQPEAGERLLETPGDRAIRLRFYNVTMRFEPTSTSRRFIVHATSIRLRKPAGLFVDNFSPQPAKLDCGGRISRTYGEKGSATYVRVLPGQSEITVFCEVTPPHGQPVDLEDMTVQLLESTALIF